MHISFLCLVLNFIRFPKRDDIVIFELIVQALDTLGRTKWRINKRILSIVDRIWNSGGRLADLVDRSDVSFFYCFFNNIVITLFDFIIVLECVIRDEPMMIKLPDFRFLCQKSQILKMKHC